MIYSEIILTGAFTALSLYLLGAFKDGTPKSISDSDYLRKKPFKYAFELTMYICGVAVVMFDNWIFISAGIGFILVGLFSDFKRNKFFKVMHYLGAVGGFTLLAFSFITLGWWWFPIIMVAMALLFGFIPYKTGSPHWICYLEIALAYSYFIGLRVYLILI